ncbi:hypothetical protein, partial [Burkholderia multivorans]|uniref:hypothetical protein n=1 Tax=Burkholderia multivorans TaxID=87883 RepID=UPI001C6145F0
SQRSVYNHSFPKTKMPFSCLTERHYGMKPTFLKQMVPRRGLGHTSATPAALASAALRVLTQSAQALCFLG